MRALFKQLYRYTHCRALRHNENFWPHLAIKRAPEGHVERFVWKRKKINIKPLSVSSSNAGCDFTIVATGPSIKELDFSALQKTVFIGVNGAYVLSDVVKFSYYIIVDRDFIKERVDIVEKIISDRELELFITAHCLNDVLNRLGMHNLLCKISIIEDVSYRIYEEKVSPEHYATVYGQQKELTIYASEYQSGFSWDIRKGIFDAGTVAYWALQISVFLGAKRVFLAGVDMNNFSAPRFYENNENKQPSFLEENFSKLIEPAFYNASKDLEKKGVKVYNLSLNSGLSETIFEKATPDEIFKKG